MKSAKWVKYPLAFFMIISGASVAYFLWSIKRKFSCCTQKDPRNDKLDVNLKLNPKRVWKEKRRGNYSEAGSYSHVIPPGVWVWRHPGDVSWYDQEGKKQRKRRVTVTDGLERVTPLPRSGFVHHPAYHLNQKDCVISIVHTPVGGFWNWTSGCLCLSA